MARQIATLDQLSRGRVIAGFGSGWDPQAFRNFGPPSLSRSLDFDFPRERLERAIEALELMIKLWTQPKGHVYFNGKYYWVKEAELFTKPVQKPHPPVWYGGTMPMTLEAIAKYFDGWYCPTHGFMALFTDYGKSVEEYEARRKKILEHAKKYNRDMSKFTWAIADGVQMSSEQIEGYIAAGCNYFIRGFGGGDFEEKRRLMGNFAKDVIPSFK